MAEQISEQVSPKWRSTASPRAYAFILLRFTLIVATAYLVLVQVTPGAFPVHLTILFAVVLATNLAALIAPASIIEASWFAAGVVVFDTAWITLALILSGSFSAEFFYLYFFVLFLAGIGENLRLIALGVVVVSSAYFFVIGRMHGMDGILTTQSLIRIPFLFAVAIFYGYLVDRLRNEQRRVREEAAVIRELQENRRYLGEVNRSLEAEVAERRRAEKELQELSELKSSFVSMVAHELRNPMTAIKYAVDILGPSAQGRPEQRFIEIIQRNVSRSTSIINDLRDLSKIEAGKLVFAFQNTDLRPVLENTVASFEGLAEEAGVAVRAEIADGLPEVWADAQRLEQVVVNLVSNAVKITPPGGSVTVRARVTDELVEVAVADTGPGLGAEDRSRVFEPFFRTDDSRQRKVTGTGLGLSISRDLVRAHGAEMDVESQPHEGATFLFRMIPDSPRAREAVHLEERVRELRVMRSFAMLLVRWSHDEDGAVADQMAAAVRSRLARAGDVAVVQPASAHIVVLLPNTRFDGARAVRRALEQTIPGASAEVLGPVMYPDDGVTGRALVAAALDAVVPAVETVDHEPRRERGDAE